MKVPWSVERCIVCLGTPVGEDDQTLMTDAHVLPRSIGGKLSADFLCRGCNSTIGHKIEAPLLADPAIRSCIEALGSQIPEKLLHDLRERQRWYAETDLGRIGASMSKDGELRPLESKTFKRDDHARREMEAEWRRQELSEEEIDELLAQLDAAPANELLELPGFTVRPKINLDELQFDIDWQANQLPPTLPLAIAFTYLGLILGEKLIYESRELDPIRQALRANASPSAYWSVEPLRFTGGCAPEHRIALKELSPLVIHIQLFQEWVWRVTLQRIGFSRHPVDGNDYGINIANGEEFSW